MARMRIIRVTMARTRGTRSRGKDLFKLHEKKNWWNFEYFRISLFVFKSKKGLLFNRKQSHLLKALLSEKKKNGGIFDNN